MERFCVIANKEKDQAFEIADEIQKYVIQAGKVCEVIESAKEISEDAECAIVLGGDGTIMQAAKEIAKKDIPLLGVNLGTLGFLTEVEKDRSIQAIEQLFHNDYTIQERMMIYGKAKLSNQTYEGIVLNDFVIGKKGFGHLITIHVKINDELADTYIADGLIIATATGSTAYNLSAGGPVLKPDIQAFVLTPICPHSLNKRSLVVSANDKVTLTIGRRKESVDDNAIVVADGVNVLSLKTNDSMVFSMAKEKTKTIKTSEIGFFQRMRSKLNG